MIRIKDIIPPPVTAEEFDDVYLVLVSYVYTVIQMVEFRGDRPLIQIDTFYIGLNGHRSSSYHL